MRGPLMRGAWTVLAVATGMATAQAAPGSGPVPDDLKRGMNEFWRRGHCELSSVIEPAKRAAASPAHPEGLAMLPARTYGRAERFACTAVHRDRLYVGSDCAVYEFDLKGGAPGRRWDRSAGLLDSPVERLVGDGDRLWAVTRAGLCAVDLKTGAVSAEGMPRFTVGVVVPTAKVVWALTDTGTYAMDRAEGRWRLGRPMPTADRVAGVVRRGFWVAEWRQRADALFHEAVVHAGSVWVISLGSLLRLDIDTGAWTDVQKGVWDAAPDGDRLWLLTTRGVAVLQTRDNAVSYPKTGDAPTGRPRAVCVGERAVWVLTAPSRDSTGYAGGGLYRWRKKEAAWQAVPKMGDQPTQFATFLGAVGGRLTLAAEVCDRIVVKSAHPGMMHVKRHVPHVTGLCVARYDAAADGWTATVIPAPKTKERYVLGQAGTRGRDTVGPEEVLQMAAVGETVLAAVREFPEKYYGGYLVSVARLTEAGRPALADYAADLGLAGEHPDLMLLSGTHGARIILATGQDRVLRLESAGDAAWAVTERRVARFADGRWQTLLATVHRFYWTATAAAVGPKAIWFGSDRGILCRFDRAAGRFTAVGVCENAAIKAVALEESGGVRVRTEPVTGGRLPADAADLTRLPAGSDLRFDGTAWKAVPAGTPWPSNKDTVVRRWQSAGGRQVNVLRAVGAGGAIDRSAYVLGVYRPRVLCQESDDVIWLGTYQGLARVDVAGAKGVDEAALAAALKAPEASKRLWGVRAVANVGSRKWAATVADLLADKDATVRREAMAVLSRLATSEEGDRIVAVLEDKDPAIRRPAVDLAGRLRLKEAVPVLIEHLSHADSRTRTGAAYALGRIGDARARPALEALLDTKDRRLKRAVTQALKGIKE